MSIEKGKNYTGCISEEDKKNIRNHIADLNADKAGLAAMLDCLSKEIAELKKQREPVVAESASTELLGSSKMEHTTEPVAWIRTAQDGRKHTVTGTSKPMPIDGYDCEPLYARPETKREPLSDYDVCEGYVTTIKEEPWTRIKAYFAGVRFAEKYHEIGGEDV